MFTFRRRTSTPSTRVSHHDAAASASSARMLAALAAACKNQQTRFPAIVSFQWLERSVRLQLAAPVDAAPEPWVASVDGLSWERSGKLSEPLNTQAPSSGLAAIGLAGRPTMLVDLVRARGLVGLDGEAAVRLEIAHRWIDEYSLAPWTRKQKVALVDLPELSSAKTVTMTIRGLIDAIKTGSSGIAFVRTLPAGADGAHLRRELESPARCWAVVILDGSGFARWTFLTAADGSVTSDVFPPFARATPTKKATR